MKNYWTKRDGNGQKKSIVPFRGLADLAEFLYLSVPSIQSLSPVIYALEGGAAISGEDKKRARGGGGGGGLEVYLKNASVLFLRSFGHLSSTGGIHFVAGRFLWPIQRDRDSVPVVNIPTLDVFVSPSRKLPFSCTPN